LTFRKLRLAAVTTMLFCEQLNEPPALVTLIDCVPLVFSVTVELLLDAGNVSGLGRVAAPSLDVKVFVPVGIDGFV